jgi:hypothetical protein
LCNLPRPDENDFVSCLHKNSLAWMSSIYFSTAETLCIKASDRLSEVNDAEETDASFGDRSDVDEEGEMVVALSISPSTLSAKYNKKIKVNVPISAYLS